MGAQLETTQRDRQNMKTQTEVRKSFWDSHPEFQPQFKRIPYTQNGKRLYRRKTQNEYPCDVRSAFCEHVDNLARNEAISEGLAAQVTL